MGKNKGRQFNASKRGTLANMLAAKAKAVAIATALGMSESSVSREILRNRIAKPADEAERKSPCAKCANRWSCRLHYVCGRRTCAHKCAGCPNTQKCRSFLLFSCSVSTRFPLCCNGCAKESRCPLDHYYYYADDAQNKARERLVASRSGMDMDEAEFREFDEIIYQGVVVNGQSVHHVIAANRGRINCSEKTVYRRIATGQLATKNIDLPRQVTLKKRKSLSSKYEYVHAGDLDRSGHLWCDWLVYQVKNGIVYHWEMDFLGKPNSSKKEVLVLNLRNFQFSLLYVFEGTTQEKVKALFDALEKALGTELFSKLFNVIVTDRDTVFDDFESLETSIDGSTARTHIFFADPGASNQKPNVENYNAQTRVVIPKKAILDDCTQEDLIELSCHLNSRLLNSISDHTPYSLFAAAFGEETAKKLGLREIPPNEVKLKPIAK